MNMYNDLDTRLTTRNVVVGLKLGLLIATCFSASVAFFAITGDSQRFGGTLSWWKLVLVYYVTLTLAGTVVGLLLHLRKTRIGSVLAGIVLVFPMYLGFSLIANTGPQTISGKVLLAGLIGVIVGGLLGISNWHDDQKMKGSS